MERDEISLEWVTVDVHGHLTGKVRGTEADEERYTQMLIDMNTYLANDQSVSVLAFHPREGDLCAGKAEDNIWYRVRIDQLEKRGIGQYGKCFLVDEGQESIIPLTHLRYLPEKFASDTKHQVKRLHLDGLQPKSLLVSPDDLSVYPGPRRRWDEAALKYMRDHIEASPFIRCSVTRQNVDSSLSVRMFLQSHNGVTVCLNDKLIRNDYAMEIEESPEAVRTKKTIEDLIRNRKQKQAKKMEHQKKQHYPNHSRQFLAHRSDMDTESVRSTNTGSPSSVLDDNRICSRLSSRTRALTEKLESESRAESDEEHADVFSVSAVSANSLPDLSFCVSGSESGINVSNQRAHSVNTSHSVTHIQKSPGVGVSPVSPVNQMPPFEGETYTRAKTTRGRGLSPTKASPRMFDSMCDNDPSSPALGGRVQDRRTPEHVVYDDGQQTEARETHPSSMSGRESSLSIGVDTVNVGYSRSRLDSDCESFVSASQRRNSVSSQVSGVGRGILSLRSVSPISMCSVSDGPAAIGGRGAAIWRSLSPSSQCSSVLDTSRIRQGNQSAHSVTSLNVPISHLSSDNSFSQSQSVHSVRSVSPASVSTPSSRGRGLFRERSASATSQNSVSLIWASNTLPESAVSSSNELSRSSTPCKGRGQLLMQSIRSDKSPSVHRSTYQTGERLPESSNYHSRIGSGLSSCSENERYDTNTDSEIERYSHAGSKPKKSKFIGFFSEKEFDSIEPVNKQRSNKQNSPNTSCAPAVQTKSPSHNPETNLQPRTRPQMAPVTQQNVKLIGRHIVTSGSESDKGRSLSRTSSQLSLIAGSSTGEIEYQKKRLPREATQTSRTKPGTYHGASLYSDSDLPKRAPVIARPQPAMSVNTDHAEAVSRMSSDSDLPKRAPVIARPQPAMSVNTDHAEAVSRMSSDSDLPKRAQGIARPQPAMPVNTDHAEAVSRMSNMSIVSSCDMAAEVKKSEVIGKMQGQRLLDAMGTMNARNNRQQPVEEVERPRKFQSSDKVLLHGNRGPTRPCQDITSSYFSDPVKKAFTENDFAAPTLVQAYSWPQIMRGRHLVAVSPPNTGKTLAFLYPLLSYFFQPDLYTNIRGNGMGAIVIILTWTWAQAERIHSEIMNVRNLPDKTRVLLVHGGAHEEKKACLLINGCEILVTTPPSLKRILTNQSTDLRRLCHLVIDDADQVLEIFRSEMIHILKAYHEVIATLRTSQCPRQILVFGSHWTEYMKQFMEHQLDNPVLIITSPFEAAIYGRVRQIPHMCRKGNKLQKVLSIVDQLDGETNHGTIIFAANRDDLFLIHDTVRKYSHYAVIVHSDMDLYQALEVAVGWPFKFLVCCDKYVSDLQISDATTVIHYDMPETKTEFGNRVACMRQYFYNFQSAAEHPVQPVSHLIISEDCDRQVKSIQELLKRSNSEIPRDLKQFMDGILEGREEDEERDLCPQIQAFGNCRDKWRCRFRHSIVPNVDMDPAADWLPTEAEVKVLVTYIVTASHYYVRMLGVRREGTGMEDLTHTFTSLQFDLTMWFSDKKNLKRLSAPCLEELCGYQENEMFYRVQILNIKEMNTKGKAAIEVEIRFVDLGRTDTVAAYQLYELPQHIKAIPFQAVEVYVCKVKPIDKDINWTYKATQFMYETLDGKELEGKIVLRLGYTLWLDPLVFRVRLGETGTIVNKFYVHTELVRNGLADENPNHLTRLYRLCENKIHISKALRQKTKLQKLDTDVLPAVRHDHIVHLASVKSPDLFFVQRAEKAEELEELMEEITEYVENQAEGDVPEDVRVGKYCLAQYASFDQRWYRGQIQAIENDNAVKIFFADYGDSDSVPRDKIREFPADKFYELPLQAIECKLAYVNNIDTSCEDKAGTAMWDLTHFTNSTDYRELCVRVECEPQPARFAGRHKFVIQMTAKYESQEVDVAQELVFRQLAQLDKRHDNNPYSALMPRPRIGMKMYATMLHKIPSLVSSCYWEPDTGKAATVAQEMLNILTKHLPSVSEVQLQTVLISVQCLVRLVSRLPCTNIHQTILDCLSVCIKCGETYCETMVQENLVFLALRCVDMNCDNPMQQIVCDFIARAASVSTVLKAAFQSQVAVDTLYELMESTTAQQVQGSLCRALAALCSGSETIFTFLMQKAIVTRLTTLLGKAEDHRVSEGALTLLDTLAQHDSGHDDLRKESLIEAIVKNLHGSDCDRCIQYSVQLCDQFASTRRKHKTFLIEKEMVIILNRLLQLPLQSCTVSVCRDLKTSLEFKVPQEPISGTAIRPETAGRHSQAPPDSIVPPRIYWSNNSFAVTLAVQVTGAGGHGNIVNYTEDSVQFGVTIDGVSYGFHYKLFDRIVVEKCRCSIKAREVLISMKKSRQGKWSRLLHDKHKPANLLVDHERVVDSSDSEVCDDTRPFTLTEKKEKNIFKNAGAVAPGVKIEFDDNEETDTSDSLENMNIDPQQEEDREAGYYML